MFLSMYIFLPLRHNLISSFFFFFNFKKIQFVSFSDKLPIIGQFDKFILKLLFWSNPIDISLSLFFSFNFIFIILNSVLSLSFFNDFIKSNKYNLSSKFNIFLFSFVFISLF